MTDRIAWPITTLDFEASGLGDGTYPIEIGAARWDGPGSPVMVWSSLIRSAAAWSDVGTWSPESQDVHGIARADLEKAKSPRDVMDELNRLLPPGSLAFVDGGRHDRYWMQRLADAAGRAPAALVGDWGHVLSHLHGKAQRRWEAYDRELRIAHRAGPDARDMLLGLADAIGAARPPVERWTVSASG